MKEIQSKILEILSQNCRISDTKLAKKIKKPRHLISYHRKQLKEKGIIINQEMLLNYEALGYTEYLIYLKLFQYSTIKEKIFSLIQEHPQVRWFGEVFPNYHLRLAFVAKNHEELEEFIHQLEHEFGNHILKKEILTHRGFLKKESYTLKEIITEKTKIIPFNLNSADKKMLQILDANPIESLVSLSKRTGYSIEAVRQKIKKFRENGLIELFSAKYESTKVGFNFWCQLLLKLKKLNKHEEKLKTLLYSDLKYGRTRKTFGNWNLEMTIFSPTYKELLNIVDELEQFFGDDLESHQLLVFRENVIPTRLPEVIFSNS